ncbi:MAG: hypothetical protein N2515_06765 [Deltaproteobacteria bacterium]|nr:hypothetical protein [Deltaproteobacteria bacterium]
MKVSGFWGWSDELGRGVVCVLALALIGSCGSSGPKRANIKPGALPPGVTLTGVYHSPQYGELHLVQNGREAIGEYKQEERRGRIQGTLEGDVLRFEWTERRELVTGKPLVTRGRGYFQFIRGEDGSDYLVGEWGVGEDEVGGGPWRAVRLRNRKPTLSTDRASSAAEEEKGDDLDSPGSAGQGNEGF